MDPSKDESNRTTNLTSANIAFRNLMSDFALVDVWRAHNPQLRGFTFYSGRHQSFSRIDYLTLITAGVVVQKTETVHMSLSDHHANLCK